MRRLLLMTLGLVLLCGAPAFAQKVKVKNKDKRFETVVKEAGDYAGRYAGFDSEHYIVVSVDAGGNLAVVSVEGARRARLENIRLEQGRLTADKVYDDGTRREFAATFANRIMNGTTTFGMIVENALEVAPSVTLNRIFFRRE